MRSVRAVGPCPTAAWATSRCPDQALPPHDTIAAAHELLAEGRPFSAHEVYARWRAGPAAERELWQGPAQLCVRITHAERGNRIGARRLIRRAHQRLETYAVTDGPTYGLDLSRIIGWIRDP